MEIINNYKYIEFLEDIFFPDKDIFYIRKVKYYIQGETDTAYIISKEKNITLDKEKEDKMFKRVN